MNKTEFEDYMESFKKKPLKEKQKIVFEQLNMLSTMTNSMCVNLGLNNNKIINRELYDLKNENYTEDDFAEALLVHVCSIQDSVCDLADNLDDLFSKIN